MRGASSRPSPGRRLTILACVGSLLVGLLLGRALSPSHSGRAAAPASAGADACRRPGRVSSHGRRGSASGRVLPACLRQHRNSAACRLGEVRINPITPRAGARGSLSLLRSVTKAALRRELTPEEDAGLRVALESVEEESGAGEPTLPRVVDALLHPRRCDDRGVSASSSETFAEANRESALALQRLCEGDLRGMFDGPTSEGLDLDAPLVVLDLSAGCRRRRPGGGGRATAVAPRGSSRRLPSASGPALATSVKGDLLAETIERREGLGEVMVFNPTRVSGVRPSHRATPL